MLIRCVICCLLLMTFASTVAGASENRGASIPAGQVGRAAGEYTVEETIRQAFLYSPALKAAQSGRQAAVAAEDRAKAGFLPTLSFSGGGGLRQSATSTTRADGQEHDFLPNMDVSLRLSQPLWTGGANEARLEMQQAAVRNADGTLQDSANSLAFEAVAAHANVLRYLSLLQVTDDNIKAHQEILSTVQSRFNEGAATSGEVTQIQSRLARVRAQRAALLAGLDAARADYLRVTGQTPSTLLALVPAPDRLFASAEEVFRLGIDQNPRMRSAMAVIEMREGERKLAKSNFYPSLSAEVGPTYERQFGARSDPERFSMEAGVRARWELYSGGGDEAALRGAGAGITQAREEQKRYVDQLQQDATSTFSATRAAIERMKEYESSMGYAKLTRENFYEQFLAGQRGLLDLLDADSEFFTSAAERINAQNDILLGNYRLLALAGGLFEALKLNPDSWR